MNQRSSVLVQGRLLNSQNTETPHKTSSERRNLEVFEVQAEVRKTFTASYIVENGRKTFTSFFESGNI